jgi:hypothetical protein
MARHVPGAAAGTSTPSRDGRAPRSIPKSTYERFRDYAVRRNLPPNLTPPQAREVCGLGRDRIRAAISSGQLRASDISQQGSTRPHWRIGLEHLAGWYDSISKPVKKAG